MPIPPIAKDGTTRVYYKSDRLQGGLDVRFDFWKLNGTSVILNAAADSEISDRGIYVYDLVVPDEDIYLVGRGYVSGSDTATPIIFKVGNATPQTLFFYSEKEFTLPPTYRIYNLLGVNLQEGDLINVPLTQFWYAPFTSLGGSPALQTDDVFFFEVSDELLAEGFTLDTSSSGAILMQAIATINIDGTRIPSSAAEKFGRSTMEGIATGDVSAIIIPKNFIRIENVIQDKKPLEDAVSNTFQEITNRLNRIKGTQPQFFPSGGNISTINVLHNKCDLPNSNIEIIAIRNSVTKLGQVVPITPVGGNLQDTIPLNVKIDVSDFPNILPLTGMTEVPQGGSIAVNMNLNSIVDLTDITGFPNILPLTGMTEVSQGGSINNSNNISQSVTTSGFTNVLTLTGTPVTPVGGSLTNVNNIGKKKDTSDPSKDRQVLQDKVDKLEQITPITNDC